MIKCLYCKTKLTVVRSTKRYCNQRCKRAFSRLSVPDQQIHSGTKVVRATWCNQHDMEREYCKLMKH